jgi:hypothetical protein
MQMTQLYYILSYHGKHYSSETRADSGRNLARLRAEQAWTALYLEHGLPLHTFRLGGESAMCSSYQTLSSNPTTVQAHVSSTAPIVMQGSMGLGAMRWRQHSSRYAWASAALLAERWATVSWRPNLTAAGGSTTQ